MKKTVLSKVQNGIMLMLFVVCAMMGFAQGSENFATIDPNNTSYNTKTTTTGWTCVNSAVVAASNTNAIENCGGQSVVINGKTSAVGTITSPVLTGGCGTFSFKYGNVFSEANGISFKFEVKDADAEVLFDTTVTVANADAAIGTTLDFTANVNVEGAFQVVITNLSPTHSSTSNKDRLAVSCISWTSYGDQPVATVAAPVFEPMAGTYYTPQTITLTSTTAGALIYYTTDGTTPTAASTLYTEPFTVSAATTVKAIAVSGTEVSAVTTANYVFPIEVANIAAFKATAAGNDIYKITGDLTYVFRSGRYMFVQDATGGLLIYDYNSPVIVTTYEEGDVISGGLCGKVSVYNGLTELVPTLNTATATTNVGTIEPVEVSAANLVANYSDYEAMLVKVTGVTFTSNTNFTQDGTDMAIYNRFNTITSGRENGDMADVTGFLCAYNTTKQLYPRNNSDIARIYRTAFTEDFEEANDWTLNNGSATNVWMVGQAQGFDNNKLFISSSNGVTNKYVNTTANVTASHEVEIPAVGAILTFDCRVNGEEGHDYLQVSITNGSNTEVLAQLSGDESWKTVSLEIAPAFAGNSTLTFAWINDANNTVNQYPAAIDNITIVETPCGQVTNLTANVTGTNAAITWNARASQNAWTFEYKLQDNPEWYTMNVTTASVNLTGLQGNSMYDMRVKANCGDDQSEWVNGTFAVECQTMSVVPTDVVVGDGTSNSYYIPFNNYYKNSWNQVIYPASEVGSAGNIYSIAWDCAATGSLSLTNMKIYLGTTSHSTNESTSDWLPMSDLTLVYEGNNVEIGTAMGWETYTFDAPFYYNGTDNLVVVVSKSATSYNNAIKYNYTSVTNAAMYRQSDSDVNYAQHPGSSTGSRSTYRANIKLNKEEMGCGDQPLCATPTELTVSNVTTTTADLAWTVGADETTWMVEYKTADQAEWTVETVTAENYTLTNLTPNADYSVRVKAVCGTNNHSNFATADFTTIANCIAPTNLTTVNTFNNTFVYWTANNNEEGWILEYKQASDNEWTSINILVEPQATLANLASSTLYDVRVKAICDANNESAWTVDQFITDCSAMRLPYAENFDSYATTATSTSAPTGYPNVTVPDCWTLLNLSETTSTYPQVFLTNYSTYAVSGNCLFFKSSNATPAYAVMPAFDGNDVKVTFTYRNEGVSAYNGTLSIGVMSDPQDPSTFVEVESFEQTTTKTQVDVDFHGLNAAHIAFKYTGGSSNNYYMAIDDINVIGISDCHIPTGLACNGSTNSSISFTWEAGDASRWEVKCVDSSTGVAEANAVVTNNNYNFTGLQSNHAYTLSVRTLCDGGVASDWAEIHHTTDRCGAADLCSFTLEMLDEYGDGWDGASIHVEVAEDGVNHSVNNYTVESTSSTETFSICNTEVVSLSWISGNYDSECSFVLYKGDEIIYTSTGDENGLFLTMNCEGEVTPPTPPTSECVYDLPYTEDFESYTASSTISTFSETPDCWEILYSGTNSGYKPHVYNGTSYNPTGTKCLIFTSGSATYGSNAYAILPEINADLNNTEVSFQYRMESASSGKLYVGYVTDATDGSSFVSLQQLTSYTTGTTFNASLAGANIPAGARLAFKWSHTSSYYSCGIDNITVSLIPTCPKPSVSNVVATQTTATVTVGTTTSATSYEVVYGEPGFDPETATPIAVGADNTVVLTGLSHSSGYEVYARAICSATDQSVWSNVYTFQTECGPVALPYTENFDGVVTTTSVSTTVMPTCWSKEFTGTSTSYGASNYASSTYSHSGVNSLKLYNYKTTSTSTSYGDALAILPEIEGDINVTAMTFYARLSSTGASYTGFFEVGVVTDLSDPFNTFIPVQTDLLPASTTYEQMTVSFADYTGPNGHIAFRATKDVAASNTTSSTAYTSVYIDDITVEQVVFNKDIELQSITPIGDACDLSDVHMSLVVVNNNTEGTISSFTASYSVNGGAAVTEVVTPETPIAIGQNYTYTFQSHLNLTEPENVVTVSVSYPGDGNANNDVLTTTGHLLDPITLPYYEDFSNVTVGSDGWNETVTTLIPVDWTNEAGTLTFLAHDEFDAGTSLISPCIQIPAGSYLISYDYNALGNMPENLNVYLGTSTLRSTWTLIGQHSDFNHTNVATTAEYLFNNTEAGIYYVIIEAASQRGNLGITFDNLSVAPAHTVTITTDNNGTVNPNGSVIVAEGSDLTLTIVPNPGYHMANLTINGQNVASDVLNANVYNYTIENIDVDMNVNATFAINQYKVVKTVNPLMAHGAFVPSATDLVNAGDALTLTMVAEPHYHLQHLMISNFADQAGVDHVADATVNGTTSTYTFDHVYADKYVTASFRIDTVAIHYTVLAGQGSINNNMFVVGANTTLPATFDQYVDYGSDFLSTFAAAPGYHIVNININGADYNVMDAWAFQNVTSEQNVTITYGLSDFVITTVGYGNGTVSDGVSFTYDPDFTYTFDAQADENYHITSILRNNVELTIPDRTHFTETLTNITENYDYVVRFEDDFYTIAATAGAHGMISPVGTTTYHYGVNADYEINAAVGYYISAITVDGETTNYTQADALNSTVISFNDILANHTISATFAQYQYTITVVAGQHGTVSPTTHTYAFGATPTFTITPAAGYGIESVTVDGVSVGTASTYTFPALTADHTLEATFAQYEYTITATAGNGGSIAPAGVTNMFHNGNQTYTITPATGYHIDNVYVDGVAQGAVNQYAFTGVQANHTIFASFAPNEYTITVNQPANGTINPGTMTVLYGATPTFVITPATGYNVTAITLNGTNVIANATNVNGVYTYTLPAVAANQTLTATMTQKTFTITATAGANGTVTPAGTTTVNFGATRAYTITPSNGYVIDNVTVDGINMGAVASYTFVNVVANHTINATFRLAECELPTNMQTINIDLTSATFSWYHPGAQSYDLQYKAINAPTFTSISNVPGFTYNVTNLLPGTTYVWYVRANCLANNSSEWTNGCTFATVEETHDGIEDHAENLVNVYANSNNVYIINENNVQIDNVRIYDVYGKLLYNGQVNSTSEVISMNVATGTYVVRLSTEKGMLNYKIHLKR